MNTTKQFVKPHRKAFHCTRNIAFSCIQTTSDLQKKLILYSFIEKNLVIHVLSQEEVYHKHTCTSSTSPTIFLFPHSLLLITILKEEILQRHVCYPGSMCENVTLRDVRNEHLNTTGCSSLEGENWQLRLNPFFLNFFHSTQPCHSVISAL